MAQRILVTGAAGKVATSLRPRLATGGRTLRLLDIVEPAPVDGAGPEEVVIASLDDPDAVLAACDGVDAIVHLGGQSKEADAEEVLRVNAFGTWSASGSACGSPPRRRTAAWPPGCPRTTAPAWSRRACPPRARASGSSGGVSRNTRRWWSLAEGEAIGYYPKDDAEVYAAERRAEFGEPDFTNDPELNRVGAWWCDWPLAKRMA